MVLTEVSGRETETQYKPTYSFVNGVTPLSPKTGRLTEYNVSLESSEKIKLLNPRNAEDGYYIESGFITTDKNINIPRQ